MTGTIHRRVIHEEEVEIPDGYEVCKVCNGRGLVNKYDLGWRTVVHSPEFAALTECLGCDARGFVPLSVRV